MSLVPLAVMVALASAPDDIALRREPSIRFGVDEAFQRSGGVQYAFSLERSVPRFLSALDTSGAEATAPHILTSRLVHTLTKDVSFFSARRTTDVDYMNTVAPGYDISARAPGLFHAARTPANDFTLEFLDEDEVRARQDEAGLRQMVELCASGLPQSVVIQHNSAFSRVMGFKTADASFTWTAHFSRGPGVTRVCTVTLSYVVTLPPFFLGGPARMHTDAVREAMILIRNLRAYPTG